MEFRDRIGKILLVTLVFILAFVAYKRTYNAPAPAAVTSVEKKSDGTSLVAKEDVEQIVRQFILDNPAVIIESIERMQQRKMDEMTSQMNEVIKNKKESHNERPKIIANEMPAMRMSLGVNTSFFRSRAFGTPCVAQIVLKNRVISYSSN